jgi:hypothetical protein
MVQTVLTVGAGEQYQSINAAIQAVDQLGGNADIQVQAGTYTNDGGYLWDGISNVTIEGVGGMAYIVDPTYYVGGKAAIVVGGQNIVLKNLDISGVSVPDGNGAGVRYDQGTLTLDHVALHGNENGILSAPDPTGSITIENSEIYANGVDGSGYTHNIYIGDIENFTLTDSYIHDANVGHEVKSRAENTTISGNVIADNNSTSSYSIDLPNGGNATITGNIIEQGPNGTNHTIDDYGGEGNLHAGNSVIFSNNTIINDGADGPIWANDGNGDVVGSNNTTYNVTDVSGTSLQDTISLLDRPIIDTSDVGFNAGATTPAPISPTTVTPDPVLITTPIPAPDPSPSAGSAPSPNLTVAPSAPPTDETAPLAGETVGVYRFFDTSNGTQFLTASLSEVKLIQSTRPDLDYEGLAMTGISSNASDPDAVPVYRFFDSVNGTHFFTSSKAEVASIAATRPDLTLEQGSFYEHASQQQGDIPVYRFFETTTGNHFFTSSAAEVATITLTRTDMTPEGVAFYAPPASS